MPFDLSSSQPVDQAAPSGGFDLASAQPMQQPAAAPGIGSQLARQAGLATRAGIEGITGIPQIITNAGIGAYNLGAMGANALGAHLPQMRSSTAALDDAMTKIGLPKPESTSEKAANIGMQMATGGAGSKLENSAVNSLIGKGPAPLAPAVQEARAAGYKIPPTQLRGNAVNRTIEGISGRDQMARIASVKNQETTNKLAARALGLPEDKQITKAAIDQMITQQGRAYDAVKTIGRPIQADLTYLHAIRDLGKQTEALAKEFPKTSGSKEVENLIDDLSKFSLKPETVVEKIKELRFDATANYKAVGDPAKLRLAKAQQGAADALDDLLERNLRNFGNPKVYKDYVAARTQIAKAYTVRRALDDASGNVSAPALGKEVAKDRPLTNELRTIGRAANAFPQATKPAQKIGSQPGISPLDLWGALLAHDIPRSVLSLGVRPALRGFALSNPGQKMLSEGIPADTMATLLGTAAPLANQGQ